MPSTSTAMRAWRSMISRENMPSSVRTSASWGTVMRVSTSDTSSWRREVVVSLACLRHSCQQSCLYISADCAVHMWWSPDSVLFNAAQQTLRRIKEGPAFQVFACRNHVRWAEIVTVVMVIMYRASSDFPFHWKYTSLKAPDSPAVSIQGYPLVARNCVRAHCPGL